MSKAVNLAPDGKTLWVHTRHYENVEKVIIAQAGKGMKIFNKWNGDVKNELNRVNKELNTEIEKLKSEVAEVAEVTKTSPGLKCPFQTETIEDHVRSTEGYDYRVRTTVTFGECIGKKCPFFYNAFDVPRCKRAADR